MSQSQLLRELRGERGLSQADVASKLGMSRPTYIALEKGERELTLSVAEKISIMYGISLDAIVIGKKLETESFDSSSGKHEGATSGPRIRVPKEKIAKFKQVLLYILGKTAGKPNVGMTVLYKLLYFSDFDNYEKYGEPIMGLRYIRNHHGPSPRVFAPVVQQMQSRGELEEVKSKYFKYDQRKYLPLKEPDLSLLSGRDIETIDDVLARYADKSATDLSRLSHMDPPWIAAKVGEDLKYELVYYRPDTLSVGTYDDL